MAEPVQDGFLREIDEELRQEHYAKLWKKYGNYIIGAALIIIVGVGGYQGWRSYDLNARMADGELYFNAMRLASGDNPQAAAQAFSEIVLEAGGGYALLARFQRAAALAKSGDADRAAALYGRLAGDSGIDPVYRDLALVLGVLLEMDLGDPAELSRRIAPLTAEDNPWRHSVREISALLAERSGDRGKAIELLGKIKNDATTPQGQRDRAEELLAALTKQ